MSQSSQNQEDYSKGSDGTMTVPTQQTAPSIAQYKEQQKQARLMNLKMARDSLKEKRELAKIMVDRLTMEERSKNQPHVNTSSSLKETTKHQAPTSTASKRKIHEDDRDYSTTEQTQKRHKSNDGSTPPTLLRAITCSVLSAVVSSGLLFIAKSYYPAIASNSTGTNNNTPEIGKTQTTPTPGLYMGQSAFM